jgi:lipopolysaccharide transport system permease protein
MTAYLREIWRSRYFWSALVRVDLRSRYRGSVLGMGWSLLHPVAMTAIFTMVFCKIFHQDPYYYAPYVLTGIALWTFLLNSAVTGCECFFRAEGYIRQHPAPLAIYPLRTALSLAFHFCIALGLATVLAFLSWDNVSLRGLAFLPVTLLLVVLLGWSLAILTGLANVYFRDTKHIVEIAFQVLFYLTPIFYNADLLGQSHLAELLRWNPVVPFLDLIRKPLLHHTAPSMLLYAKACTIVLMAMGTAAFALSRMERRLIFHL